MLGQLYIWPDFSRAEFYGVIFCYLSFNFYGLMISMNLSYSRLVILIFLGIYTFMPSNACLLRDYVYPLVRREPNLFPHPFVHLLHDQSKLPLDINEIRSRFPSLDKQYFFVMLEWPTYSW
jgi:hypothetical protein